MLKRFIASQFRHPEGISGRFVGKLMARGNRRAQDWTISLLGIRSGDRILEVGYGPGIAIELAARQTDVGGKVEGIDASRTMLAVASKRNSAAIATGQVALRCGDVSFLPYSDNMFDKVLSIHCLYFWPNPVRALAELRRVLIPGGIATITILPKDRWLKQKTSPPPDLFTLYGGDEVAELLERAGFGRVRVIDGLEHARFPCVCVTGVKRADAGVVTLARSPAARVS